MPFGLFILSAKRRKCLYRLLVIVMCLEIFFGILIAVVSLYIYIIVAPILPQENAEIAFVFVIFALYGTQIMFTYAVGLKIAHKCYYKSHKKSTRKILELWSYATILLIFNLIIISVMVKKVSRHMVVSTTHSLQIGIINYLKDITWKKEMDKLQVNLECCGVYGYKDWYEYDWIPKSMVMTHTDIVRHFSSPDGKFFVVPWSCCRINFPMQCLHDPLQQLQSHAAWDKEPQVVADSLNADGCLAVYEAPIYTCILFFEIIVALIIIFAIIGFLIARILYTSCRNALILGTPDEASPGWIFGRGDCGYFRGYSLLEIMEKEKQKKENKHKGKGYKTEDSSVVN